VGFLVTPVNQISYSDMPKSAQTSELHSTFSGFDRPKQNWFKMPKMWTDITSEISSIAELKVVEYVLKHTWGYQEYGLKKRITLDEFRHGRKGKNRVRMDKGTGLSKPSVIAGIKSAVKRGLLEEAVDDSDKARVKKYYSLRMKQTGPGRGEGGGVKNLNAGVKNFDPDVKEVDPSGQKLRHRTKQETLVRKQQQQERTKEATGSGADKTESDLAAALIDRGIKATVARQLTRTYNRQRIEANLDWWVWKQDKEPTSIKINPAGLLRRAIEDDYASEGHHKGFQTRQQKAAVAAQQKQRLQQQQKLAVERDRQQQASVQQKETERAKRLKTLREQYHSTPKERSLWSQVLSRLKRQMSAVSFNTYLAQSDLLSLRNSRAVIAVPNRFVKGWLEERLADTIQQTLADYSNGQNIHLHFRPLETGKNEHQTSSTGANKSPPPGS
jgi:hypothetical protein